MASRPMLVVSVLLALVAGGCREAEGGPLFPDPGPPSGFAAAHGLWQPAPGDGCSRALHDAYAVTGPDGLIYPTWHPPVDPVTGCSFGHEHGRDPAGSDLFALVGPIPFGYANEHLGASGFAGTRTEDHVGHKIEWENDMPMRIGDGGDAVLAVRCDVLVKLHQGTHSPDAFTNNLHEIAYHLRCTDGTGFSATLLTPIGNAGEHVASCESSRRHDAGPPSPLASPDGGGTRRIPDVSCVRAHLLREEGGSSDFGALRESWEVHARLKREDGHTLASFDPYFQVLDPSRFFDPEAERRMGRPVDLCFGAGPRARGGPCEAVERSPAVAWDDARSPFKGARRFVDVNGNRVANGDGPNRWYTDPLGERGSPLPFVGSLVQWVSRTDSRGLDLHGPVIGKGRSYDAAGVHAPN